MYSKAKAGWDYNLRESALFLRRSEGKDLFLCSILGYHHQFYGVGSAYLD
jgi:hypothetical protein